MAFTGRSARIIGDLSKPEETHSSYVTNLGDALGTGRACHVAARALEGSGDALRMLVRGQDNGYNGEADEQEQHPTPPPNQIFLRRFDSAHPRHSFILAAQWGACLGTARPL